jgi:hypothetical protein
VRPSLATTGGSLLILSSPFARRGEVWDLYDKHYGAKGDPGVLVVHGESRAFNASPPKAVVDRALARNPIAGRAEWLAEFRGDLEGFVSLDTIRACTGPVAEWPPVPGIRYVAGIDVASGSGEDSLALAVCHADADQASDKVIVDYVRAWQPPFSPSAVLGEVADHCRRYRVETAIGDRFAYGLVREMLRDHNVGFRLSDRTTSQNFSELAPMLNAGDVLLPRHQVLLDQLGSLERKPSSRGREWIGHGVGGHDDLAAAVAVAVCHCTFAGAKQVFWRAATEDGMVYSEEHPEGAYVGELPSTDVADQDWWADVRKRVVRNG